jgi:GT2 family glycosyltransferase
MDLSIVIVSHNVRRELERAIAATLADSSRLDVELVVVDNASTDGSVAASIASFPGVTVIANPDNRYYTAANNQGFDVARGRFILVLNPDTEILPGTLQPLLAALDARPEVGIASGRMLWPDGRVQANCCAEQSYLALLLANTPLGLLLPPLRTRVRARDWYDDWDRQSEREVGVLPGSFLLVRKRVLHAVGGFDERLRLYFAEDEWCGRIARAGYGVRYLAIGGVVHPERASVRQTPRQARRLYFEDLARYTEIRFGRARARLLALLAWPLRTSLEVAGRLRGERA